MVKRLGVVDYSRQSAMNNNLQYKPNSELYNHPTIVIIGCGGVGFWVGILACMLGYQKFVLYDSDKVEESNLNRLPLQQRWLGKEKVLALKMTMRAMRPDIIVACHNKKFNPDVDIKYLIGMRTSVRKFIIDCTDNAITQRKIYNGVKDTASMDYCKIGYEGFQVGAYNTYNVWINDEENYQTGYRTSSANAISSSMAAGLGLLKAISGNRSRDLDVNLLSLATKGGKYGLDE